MVSFHHHKPRQCQIDQVLSGHVCPLMLAWHKQCLWNLTLLEMIGLQLWIWFYERHELTKSGNRFLLTISLLWDWIEKGHGMWQCIEQVCLERMLHHSQLLVSWMRQPSQMGFLWYKNGILGCKADCHELILIWVRDNWLIPKWCMLHVIGLSPSVLTRVSSMGIHPCDLLHNKHPLWS